MASEVTRQNIGLSELAWKILDEQSAASGCASRGEYVEWLILSQKFERAEAEALWRLRRRRGGLGGVYVLPDDANLPPRADFVLNGPDEFCS